MKIYRGMRRALTSARIGGRLVAHKIRDAFSRYQWFLGYKFGESADMPDTFSDLKYIVPPKDRFWADPFPIEVEDKYFIFVEEFVYTRNKGHISAIEIDRHGDWKEPVKVLEEDYHLSYPYVFQYEGQWYMIPESSHNNDIHIYRCAAFPNVWEPAGVLLKGLQAVDPTLHRVDGLWWMFVNIGGERVSLNDELHLFYADTPFGPWKPHRRNPVKSDVRSARPAGRLFYRGKDLYRPAQDCSVSYGYAVALNKVFRLNPDEYSERQVARILPRWRRGIEGVHTFNTAGRLTVVDCLRYRLRSPFR
jgi:hypothetical protein